jgi:hypothetical protein
MCVDEERSNTMQEEVLSADGITRQNKHRKISLVYHGFVYVSLTV